MIRHLLVLAALLATATPAIASETIECRAGRAVVLRLSVASGGVQQATLISPGGVERSSAGPQPELHVAQAWIDRTELKADLLDGNAEVTLGTLRTRAQGSTYVGTLVRGRTTVQVRCGEAG